VTPVFSTRSQIQEPIPTLPGPVPGTRSPGWFGGCSCPEIDECSHSSHEIVILVALLTVGTVWEFEMERLVTETRAVQTLFNTLLGGIILFVSVVLSINTAALAQEFAPLQVKLASIEDSIDFQIELEELVEDGISPAGLQPFLQYVIEAIHSETESLRTTDGSTTDERARANLLTFADDIDTRLSQIERRIRQSDPRVSILLLSTRSITPTPATST